MKLRLLVLATAFLAVRSATTLAYRDTYHYYGMVANQFAIAEAAYRGHSFAHDPDLYAAALQTANREQRHVPLEEWQQFSGSGRYVTFPAIDLPGLGYLIAATSRAAGTLTTRYAMALQIALEGASVVLFSWCVGLVLSPRTGVLAGWLYVFAYPFVWPIASHPMRDVFAVGVFACGIAAVLVFLRGRGAATWAASLTLVAVASALLWIRPHAYYYLATLVPFVLLAPRPTARNRVAFAGAILLVPWIVFAYPLRLFNLRHYGVPATDSVGLALWQQMGAVPNNPYGFVRRDDAMGPWVLARYGKDLAYACPEMNRLLGDHARRVIREHPEYYFLTVATIAREIATTPLDFVPPFRLVEYSSSGLSLPEFLMQHPGSFAFKAVNRVLMVVYFHGGLLLTAWLLRTRRSHWLEITLLLSPFLYTLASQLAIVFNQRYMASGAWVLVVPFACALEASFARLRASRG